MTNDYVRYLLAVLASNVDRLCQIETDSDGVRYIQTVSVSTV